MSPIHLTLPDHLRSGLDVVFIGINPGLYSAERGHYFARRTSRFWPAFSQSRLSEPVRRSLGVKVLQPKHDCELPRFGSGLTDLVKRATSNASELTLRDFQNGVPLLLEKLRRDRPLVACFHGMTAYRPFLDLALEGKGLKPLLGPQPKLIGSTRLYIAPNPSPANAHFTAADQTAWYDQLANLVDELKQG